jgi:exopolyphosphatase/guanosine-5'-triphosphate,3'-diphosphate pyrophosphatase
MPARSRPLLAAVDLGSNSFHLVVARVAGGSLHVIDRLRERVALAAGLDERKRLLPDAQRRALACLARFGQRIGGLPEGAVRAVGTNTLRQASNGREFLQRAQQALGHPIEVISGQEEARLIYLGVSHATAAHAGRRLVVDVGGGSTECIIGEGFEPRAADSLFMGCLTWTQRFFEEGAISRKRMDKAVLAARLELEPLERRYRRIGWARAIGSSGTILSIDSVLRDLGWSEAGITRDGLDRLRGAVVAASNTDDLALPGLTAERASILPGGLAILLAVFAAFRLRRMAASSGALREGLLHDLIGRIRHEDVRDAAIDALADRHRVDLPHARLVEREVVGLLEQASVPWRLGERIGEALRWAARLHEVGLAVAHAGQHKHGAYLVQHSHLAGFSRDEQEILATLIRCHRRKLDADVLAAQGAVPAETALRACVLLRIAALLHRARDPRVEPRPKLRVRGRRVELRFPRGFLTAHPLTRADLEEEATLLRDAGMRLIVA